MAGGNCRRHVRFRRVRNQRRRPAHAAYAASNARLRCSPSPFEQYLRHSSSPWLDRHGLVRRRPPPAGSAAIIAAIAFALTNLLISTRIVQQGRIVQVQIDGHGPYWAIMDTGTDASVIDKNR